MNSWNANTQGFVRERNVFVPVSSRKSGEIGMQIIKKFSRSGRSMKSPSYRFLKEGRCVRPLSNGEFSKNGDRWSIGSGRRSYLKSSGGKYYNIVDLDGAIAGESLNLPVIWKNLARRTYSCAVGGIRFHFVTWRIYCQQVGRKSDF